MSGGSSCYVFCVICYLARLDTDYAVKVVTEMIDMSFNVMTFELFFMTFELDI